MLVPAAGIVTVRWYRAADGRCYAREFYESNSECKASLLALARQVAAKGHVGKVPENGHKLIGEYDGIYELKPGDYRFFGFRDRTDFYITNAAPKQSRTRRQEPDYKRAKMLREEYFTESPQPGE